jgi:glycosyltransferase involved in cell wall biosynthesis
VYNEVATVGELLEGVAQKQIPGADKEVIIVESNSTDGSREMVSAFHGRPQFRVLLEDRPRGKGAATRLGISEAKGDIILIQDADLEYDLEDYDSLLEPIIAGREAFVLGARHGGGFWKMRQFEGQWAISFVMNLAHWFFTLLINVAFGTRLRDPFTMYKVFRRDAVAGLEFRCSRFDFDWELLILLVRKGYRPIEVPVNYRSRSYEEGKRSGFSPTRSRGFGP